MDMLVADIDNFLFNIDKIDFQQQQQQQKKRE